MIQKEINKIQKKFGRTIAAGNLINDNDKILIGLSGGKDSLTLTDLLYQKQKYYPVKFSLYAAYIEIAGIGEVTDIEYLSKFCCSREIPLFIKKNDVNFNSDLDKCYNCSTSKRKVLFDLCKELNCGKLALGHNLDDNIETILLNMFYQGRISGICSKLNIFNGNLEIIRPLLDISENEIETYVRLKGLITNTGKCRYSYENSRNNVKEIIAQLAENNDKVKYNIKNSISNVKYFNQNTIN